MSEFIIDELSAGERLDIFVAEKLAVTRSAAERLVQNENVIVNDGVKKKNYKLSIGDIVRAELPLPKETEIVPQDIPIDVVYEDDDIIVVNKAKGMVVHPAPGNPDGTLVNALLFHCSGSLSGIGGEIRPGIVHRIDKDTSGLIVAAKNDKAHISLAEQIKTHSAARVYQAVIVGHLKQNEGTINAPIGRDVKDRKKMAINYKNGKTAVTHYSTIAEYKNFTHIRCSLETGRTHQIRVHFASIGHPLAGDCVYGGKKQTYGLDGQCLHADQLTLVHPSTHEKMVFRAPLPRYFIDFLHKLEKI